MRIAGILFVLMTAFSTQAAAQDHVLGNLSDSEFLNMFSTRTEPRNPSAIIGTGQAEPGRKCSFDLMAEAARRLPLMNPDDANTLRKLLAAPNMQVSVLSPSGRFRVHYDTTGKHIPAMIDASGARIPGTAAEYADSVAATFDYVYEVEIEQLGYEIPPIAQGFNEYQVYILEYNGSYYGETAWTGTVVNPGVVKPTYASYIQLDNDYREFYSKGLDGVRVTAAHEYHHAIQLGRYGLWAQDRWMHEMSSTYYEEFVYPEVNDYLIYVRNFMKFPDRAMYGWGNDGYELVLWPMLLENRHGPALMKDFWVGMKQHEPVTSMRNALASAGGDFSSDFCTWAKTNFFTAWRAGRIDPVEYVDAETFPSVKFAVTQELVSGNAAFSGLVQPLSSQYLRVARGLDTVAFVVSNVDLSSAIARSTEGAGFNLDVRETAPDASWHTLTNGWAYKFTAVVANALCMHVLDAGTMPTAQLREPYPNPLLLAESSRLHFPLPRDITVNRVELSVFSSGMSEIYKKDNLPVQLDDIVGAHVAWDVDAGDGVHLASGVYFFVLSYNGEKRFGKFAVIAR